MATKINPEYMKRLRWLWPAGALFLCVVVAVLVWNRSLARENPDLLTAAERAWLQAHPVIRLAVDPDYPPVEYFAGNGVYSGISADYVALLEKKLGIRITIVRLRDWHEVISKARRREIDVYVATKTPQRADYLLFSRPFLEFPAAIIVRNKVKAPLTLEKLAGMKVSVVSEYAAHNFIAHHVPRLQLDLVPDVKTGLRRVSFGLSDAFVESLASATYYMEEEGITNLRFAGESGYVYRMGFCTRKDWPELNRILDKGLAAISAAEKKAIYKKWVPVEPRSLFASREFQTGLAVAVSLIVLGIVGVIAWNRALTQQVRLRTAELENELAERRRVEEELARARDGLEMRVQERTRELAEKNNFLRTLMDAIPDLIFYKDCSSLYLGCNRAFEAFAGRSEKDLVGCTDLALFSRDAAELFREMDHLTVSSEESRRNEEWVVYPNGRRVLLETLKTPFFDLDGEILGVVGVSRDITERKRLEEELLLSHFCINEAAIGIIQLSLDDGKILRVNYSACLMHGYTSEEMCAMSIFDVDTFATRESFAELRRMVDQSGSMTFETVGQRKDGTLFPVEVSTNDLEFQGKRYGFSFFKDITERKRAEEALRESESSVRRKLGSILDPEGDTGELDLADILDVAQIQALMEDLYRITGHKMGILDLQGRVLVDVGWQDICSKFHRKHPKTLQNCFESDSDLAVGVPRGAFRTYRCKNNMWHIVTPIFVGERHMGNLFLGQFFFSDEQIDYDLFRSQARMYGFPEGDYLAALEAVPRHSQEHVNLGKAIFLRLTDMFSRLSYANIKLAHAVAERDLLTATLQEANLVVENSPAVLFRWKGDDVWSVELVSGNIIQFGYPAEVFLSGALSYSQVIHPEDLERVRGEVHGFCTAGNDQFRLEYRIITRAGAVRWVNEHTNVERDGAGFVKNFEGIVIDVTERKLAEEELQRQKELLQELNETLEKRVGEEVAHNREKDIMLIQQNRQAALGELLDHIAHQWKQPLTSLYIVTHDLGDAASTGTLTDDHVMESVTITISLLDHMLQTMDVFRGFYRPDKEKKVFSIKESIDQALAFIAPAFRFNAITVELDVDPGLTAFGYPKEYAQVLLNILANARDVFKTRGTERPRVVIRALAEESRSVVTIADNAGGIPEAIVCRIFDFYFTTNESGGGTGIGLYMSKNIIEKNMGGTLCVENTDEGAQFRIEVSLT
jgi:PAS domain S-box-containing protein